MVDVVLINSNVRSKARERLPHYGLSLLASCLIKEGFSVRTIDGDFDYLEKEDIIEKTVSYAPFVVGMCASSHQIPIAMKIAKDIKKTIKNVKIVLGGAHITADPEFSNQSKDFFDYFVVGEAELAFPDLVRKIKNKSYSDRVIKAKGPQDLDSLPFPAYFLYDMQKCKVPLFRKRTSYVFVSRDCPFNCSFCPIPLTFDSLRYRSPKNIVSEVKYFQKKFSINNFFFQCGTFTLNRNHVISLCEEIKNSKLNFTWGASTRCNLIDEELLSIMKEAGCINLNFGAESGSYRIRKLIGKDFTDEEIRESYRICKNQGIDSTYFWLLGNPTETIEDIQKTIELSLEVGDFAGFSETIIYIGTKLYVIALKEGKITKEAWYDHLLKRNRLPYYTPDGIKREQIASLLREAYRRFYFRPRQIHQLLKRINPYTLKLYGKQLKSIFLYNKLFRKTVKF